jgi:hypothetical protein
VKKRTVYIEFERIARIGKQRTNRWRVTNLHGIPIGTVYWHTPWRQYTFFPAPQTLFERNCLRLIADFCERETMERRRQQGKLTPIPPLTAREKAES